MEILSASQLKQADEYTMQVQGLTSWQLMERASRAILQQLKRDFGTAPKKYAVFCGPGNNGGDGLALARMLANQGKQVHVYLIESPSYTPDNLQNQQLLKEAIGHHTDLYIQRLALNHAPATDRAAPETLLIDALFGYGLTRSLGQEWAPLIGWIGRHRGPVISIDMPSGLFADRPSDPQAPIVKATRTYTFHAPKMGLLQPQNAPYTGELTILDIGLDTGGLQSDRLNRYYTDAKQVRASTPQTNRFAHKGTFGHVLIAGGSRGKIGSVLLGSRAALRTGCGLVTAYVPACGYEIIQTAFPEAMVWTGQDAERILELPAADEVSVFRAIGLGMGMGTASPTQAAFRVFLTELAQREHKPALVLDADALNILSENRELLERLPKETILTPHPKELERLIGPWDNDWQKLEMSSAFARAYGVITLIKGAHTAIVLPDGSIHFNATGNPGMATAGSGDVLTGMIASLLAQGLNPEAAAICGVYLHGSAGDLAIRNIHPGSLIASDLVDHISAAWINS